MMNTRVKSLLTAVAGVLLVQFMVGNWALAAIIWSGDVDPEDPSTWTNETDSYIGNTADGSLTVGGGSALLSKNSIVGKEAGTFGQVTVDGTGSNWTSEQGLFIGYHGVGSLQITSGGTVDSEYGDIRGGNGSISHVLVNGTDSIWRTQGGAS